MQEMTEKLDLSYRKLCGAGVPAYSSLMRWKGRMARGESAIRKAGPKKVEPFDFDAIRTEVSELSHCRKRTHGTGELYRRYSGRISRRDFQELVTGARLQANWERRCQVKHLCWHKPCFVWAIDDTKDGGLTKQGIYLDGVRDVGSRYELPPAVSEKILHGEDVARHMNELFEEYGPPLFLKRDWGSNLNSAPVDEMLSEHLVIPLNSPVSYPQYNGSRERGQWEMKTYMHSHITSPESARLQHIRSLAVEAAHILNHRSRRCLGGKMSCEVFFAGQDEIKQYDRRKRKEVYNWIKDRALGIMKKLDGDGPRTFQKAWRTACEIWLQQAGVLTVSVQGCVLPEKTAEVVS